MKKLLLGMLLLFGFVHDDVIFAVHNANTLTKKSPTSLQQAIKNHPHLCRAAIIFLTTLEFLALNKKMDLFGISCPSNTTLKGYLAHNLTKSFPTVTNTGPLIDGTELRSLGIIGGLSAQNYYLAQISQEKPITGEQKIRLALESTVLTAGGGILAWTASLLYGAYKCTR
jgi:hypothetical protein